MFTIYILVSESSRRTYVGQTENIDSRLKLHQSGRVRSTAKFRPWVILHREEAGTRAEGIAREKWFKSRLGRKMIRMLMHEAGIK